MSTNIFLLFLKLILSTKYYKKLEQKKTYFNEFSEKKYTIVQAILSGDDRLQEDLSANLRNTKEMKFLWLVDRSDSLGQKIVNTILKENNFKNRVHVILVDEVPSNINPKIYKLDRATRYIQTEYAIILDDDTVIDPRYFKELRQYEEQKEVLVTGIPYNYGTTNFFSKLLAAFVNSNSFLTYFSMAELQENKSINGMFYIVKKEVLEKYKVFEHIKYFLCDDLALAHYLVQQGIPIYQSRIFCNVRTTIPNIQSYLRQMKRWLLFSNIYIKKYFSYTLVGILLLPNILPFLALGISFCLETKYFIFSFLFFVFKSCILYTYRYYLLELGDSIFSIFYEIIADILLPLLFLYTCLTPPVIIWRNKKIRVNEEKIRYE